MTIVCTYTLPTATYCLRVEIHCIVLVFVWALSLPLRDSDPKRKYLRICSRRQRIILTDTLPRYSREKLFIKSKKKVKSLYTNTAIAVNYFLIFTKIQLWKNIWNNFTEFAKMRNNMDSIFNTILFFYPTWFFECLCRCSGCRISHYMTAAYSCVCRIIQQNFPGRYFNRWG